MNSFMIFTNSEYWSRTDNIFAVEIYGMNEEYGKSYYLVHLTNHMSLFK